MEKPINKKKKVLYKRLCVLSELLLQNIEDLEKENKSKSPQATKYKEHLQGVKEISERILEITYQDPNIKSTTYFTDLTNKIDTIIRHNQN